MTDDTLTIGFSNLSETIPFAVTVREGLESAMSKHPNIKFVVRDNDFDNDRAMQNAQEFLDMPVDLAIIFHIDERFGSKIRGLLAQRAIPIIAVDIPIILTTFFGIDNRAAGRFAGEALGEWVKAHWDGQMTRLVAMTEQRAVSTIRERITSAVDGAVETIDLDRNRVLYIDGATRRDVAYQRMKECLREWDRDDRIGVVCSNDDTALGCLDAAREMNREDQLAVVGQGANLAPDELRNPDSRFIASTAYYPENYGQHLIALALRILNKERVPQRNTIEPVCVTRENLDAFLATK